ncbi:response regulator transcription factor [Neorhizobium sp. T786]|uniref:LuxR C-terminal-related transcriptional regulator n=1 Tax=Pseudorhizobium xiangyangii TaxID=2883104 RepID=UPI001CFFB0D0|nr:response regulator transcription factor [Neorhizobium xiangyangii]MCB5204353.1 response regulator transcription factor [Neorhizobium xiangyangii]
MAISVAFVDDHPILLDGLVSLCSNKSDLNVVGQGSSAFDILRIAEDLRPDVMVVDLSMPGDPVASIETLTQKHPAVRVVVFTAAPSIETAVQMLKFGVSGYVLKGGQASELFEAIRAASAGETFITPCFASKVIMAVRKDDVSNKAGMDARLSYRELQIVRLLMRGSRNREIATSLNISEKTVKHYMSLLMQKLAVRNRVEVVLAAQKMNMLADRFSDAGSKRLN